MREGSAFLRLTLLGAAVIVLRATDLADTVVADGPSWTAVAQVPPSVEVCLLLFAGLAAAVAGIRWRRVALTEAAAVNVAMAEADRLLKAIDSTSAVIYMRDEDGRYLLINRQYEELFDVQREDVIGLTDHDLFPAEVADDFRANDLKALAHGAPLQMEEFAPHPDGPHTYITVQPCPPIRDGERS